MIFKYSLSFAATIILITSCASNKTTERTSSEIWEYEDAKTILDKSRTSNQLLTLSTVEWLDKSIRCKDSESFFPFRNDDFILFRLGYPEKARKRNEEGLVRLTFEIDETGKTGNFTILKSASPSLDKEVIDTIDKSKFIPGFCNKKPSKVLALFQFQFNLPQVSN